MLNVVWLIVGILIGVSAAGAIYSRRKPNPSGTLKVYVPDIPDESPYLYLELNAPVSAIVEKSEVIFRVDMQNLNTQK